MTFKSIPLRAREARLVRQTNSVTHDPKPYLEAEVRLFQMIKQKTDDGEVLPCMHSDPDIIGQVMHEIIDGSCVYLIVCNERASDAIHVKIGMAKNVSKRLSSINTSNPLDVSEVHYFCVGPDKVTRKIEKDLHQIFSRDNYKGEWFFFSGGDDFNRFLDEVCGIMKDKLGGYFNRFLFRPKKTSKINDEAIRNFIQYAWDQIQEDMRLRGVPTETYESGGYAAVDWEDIGRMKRV